VNRNVNPTATLSTVERSPGRLMLGTVQFGMPYGVANRTGQPGYAEVVRIVATAVEGGVRWFDTAAAYGSSEEVLGRALGELKLRDAVTVVTKIAPLSTEEVADPVLARAAIERSVEQSRQRLGLERLPVVLFHREADAAHLEVLDELRVRGVVERVGVSCDNPAGGALGLIADRRVAALQIPANLLDRRHLASGLLPRAASRGVFLFVRSAFLQGLLVMPEDEIPSHLRAVLPARSWLESIAQEAGMTLAELAVRFLQSQPGVTSVLCGVETVAQMRENLRIADHGPLPEDLLARLMGWSPELPEALVTPSAWAGLAMPLA
jgi:aryl-alcohol dehydrogenase-like predicted oxidoreductase